jgi:hypothetical protein
VLLWLGFVGFWARVFQQTRFEDVARSLGLLTGLGALYGIIVAIWVGHNISLARRRNRRQATETITVFPSHDYLGLPVEIHSNLVSEQEIEIRIVNGVKQYLPKQRPTDFVPVEAPAAHEHIERESGDLVADKRGVRE